MSKLFVKMTKAELINEAVKLQAAKLALESKCAQLMADKDRLRSQIEELQATAPVRRERVNFDVLRTKAERYCQLHGVRSVDRETLLHWQG